MPSQVKYPSVAAAISTSPFDGGQVSWSDIDNVKVDDTSYASALLGIGQDYTDGIAVSGFGFTIPTGSVITGVEVRVDRYRVGVLFKDYVARIVKGGVVGSADKAKTGGWPGVEGRAHYGGDGDLWNESWTSGDINSDLFGFAISGQDAGSEYDGNHGRIDNISIKVYYTDPPASSEVAASSSQASASSSQAATASSSAAAASSSQAAASSSQAATSSAAAASSSAASASSQAVASSSQAAAASSQAAISSSQAATASSQAAAASSSAAAAQSSFAGTSSGAAVLSSQAAASSQAAMANSRGLRIRKFLRNRPRIKR